MSEILIMYSKKILNEIADRNVSIEELNKFLLLNIHNEKHCFKPKEINMVCYLGFNNEYDFLGEAHKKGEKVIVKIDDMAKTILGMDVEIITMNT